MFTKRNGVILLRLLILLLILSIIGYLFVHLFAIFLPFILGTFVAFLMVPLINVLEKRYRMHRSVATLIILLLFLVVGTTFITLITAQIISEGIKLAYQLPNYIAASTEYMQELLVQEYFVDYFDTLNDYYQGLPAEAQHNIMMTIQSNFPSLVDQVQAFIKTVLTDTVRIVGGIPGTLTIVVVAILAAYFIAKDWNLYKAKLQERLPEEVSDKGAIVYHQLVKAFGGYIKAQAILVSVTGVIVIIGLIALDVEYAFTLGLISAFLDILPYIGIGLLFVPWVIYLFIFGQYKLAIGLSVLYLAIAITRQSIEPQILSSSVGTKPLPTLIALYVGLKTLGVFGLIMGPIILVLLTTLYKAEVFHDIWKVVKE
ncbi:sporulation integral membrane protein YtvI [Desulfuribacillus stibiiarsenatis]|uniref:sporulation integral membrane protein YtvI n=1 Tax=Desulfuribacillus stibiiarsenatis TaxID=1390249 RepID=UPI001C406435|nr:sporulation integral membrane protein YtvI [Desulfuribacillus stibiiarsenatis]